MRKYLLYIKCFLFSVLVLTITLELVELAVSCLLYSLAHYSLPNLYIGELFNHMLITFVKLLPLTVIASIFIVLRAKYLADKEKCV